MREKECGVADIMQKKNSKLETFLFHALPDQKYERIRGYEACIVVSEKENKSFKYVVLGDEWIYLTENPPKTIQETVCLGEVISVELVSIDINYELASVKDSVVDKSYSVCNRNVPCDICSCSKVRLGLNISL